jgi:hypothetical protein
VAAALTAAGHQVVRPDLRDAATTGDPHGFVSDARAATAQADVVAGHSGAGFFLPLIATGRRPPPRLVFVDAGIPPDGGPAAPAGGFVEALRARAAEGVLPLWSTWWGAGAMERLVPDLGRRRDVEAELPRVALRFYETEMTMPTGWRAGARAGYVLLSDAYRADAVTAQEYGWPTVELAGTHLHLVNDPEAVANALLAVARAGP